MKVLLLTASLAGVAFGGASASATKCVLFGCKGYAYVASVGPGCGAGNVVDGTVIVQGKCECDPDDCVPAPPEEGIPPCSINGIVAIGNPGAAPSCICIVGAVGVPPGGAELGAVAVNPGPACPGGVGTIRFTLYGVACPPIVPPAPVPPCPAGMPVCVAEAVWVCNSCQYSCEVTGGGDDG